MIWNQELIKEAEKIINQIYDNNTLPCKDLILRFTELDPSKIKIIILGQDPYPTRGVPIGRAFAVNPDAKIPASLRNIFKEINEVQGYLKTDQTLSLWVKQGVLLLNTSLTVKEGIPNSHSKYWNPFTSKLIKWLDDNFDITWVLWGNEAKKFKSSLKNKVIVDAHPSPLSYRYRKKNTFKELSFIEW